MKSVALTRLPIALLNLLYLIAKYSFYTENQAARKHLVDTGRSQRAVCKNQRTILADLKPKGGLIPMVPHLSVECSYNNIILEGSKCELHCLPSNCRPVLDPVEGWGLPAGLSLRLFGFELLADDDTLLFSPSPARNSSVICSLVGPMSNEKSKRKEPTKYSTQEKVPTCGCSLLCFKLHC